MTNNNPSFFNTLDYTQKLGLCMNMRDQLFQLRREIDLRRASECVNNAVPPTYEEEAVAILSCINTFKNYQMKYYPVDVPQPVEQITLPPMRGVGPFITPNGPISARRTSRHSLYHPYAPSETRSTAFIPVYYPDDPNTIVGFGPMRRYQVDSSDDQ